MVDKPGFEIADQGGASSVEFALLLPILALLVLGVIQFGLIINAQAYLTHAAYVGARRASIVGTEEQADQLIYQSIMNAAGLLDEDRITKIYIFEDDSSPEAGTILIPSGTDFGYEKGGFPPLERKTGVPVAVRIEYEQEVFLPLINQITGNPMHLTSKTAMQVEPGQE